MLVDFHAHRAAENPNEDVIEDEDFDLDQVMREFAEGPDDDDFETVIEDVAGN